MSLTGSRLESYRFELLDGDEHYLRDLATVTGGELSFSRDSDLRSGGSIELSDDEANWLDARIRITYMDGSDTYPLGTFIVASPGKSTDGVVSRQKLELYSKLLVLSADLMPTSYSVGAGTVVTSAVRALIANSGEANIALTDSAATTATDTVWPAGTSRLRIANDLLASVNYFALDTDRNGAFIAKPYVSPASRPSVWTFADGAAALHKSNLSLDADYFSVPNRVVLVSGDPEAEMTAVAEDTDSEFGYYARGRWITDFRSGIEATDQATLDAMAQRILAEARQVTEKVALTHPYLPIAPNDVVTLTDSSLGISARYAIAEQKHALGALGAVVTSTLSRVVA